MTNKELLLRIDEDEKFLEQYFGAKFKGQSALRAVVELHKPKPEPTTQSFLDGKWTPQIHCQGCSHSYPCPTIQAIEKELA